MFLTKFVTKLSISAETLMTQNQIWTKNCSGRPSFKSANYLGN